MEAPHHLLHTVLLALTNMSLDALPAVVAKLETTPASHVIAAAVALHDVLALLALNEQLSFLETSCQVLRAGARVRQFVALRAVLGLASLAFGDFVLLG